MNWKNIVLYAALFAVSSGIYYVYGGRETPAGQPALADLTPQTFDSTFVSAFNAAASDTRLVNLISPTCVNCLRGASELAGLLSGFAGRPLRAFVVWEPVLFTDWTAPGSAALRRVADPRAAQFWDRQRLVSKALGERDDTSVVWDHVAVYPPGASWTQSPPKPLFAASPLEDALPEAKIAIRNALALTP